MPSVLGRTFETLSFLADDPVRTARTGTTPHDVVFRQGKIALRHFPAAADKPRQRAVLVSMPLINTWSVWDLLPGKSVFGKLSAAGIPVYVVDWGRPGDEDATRPLSYYVDEVLTRLFDRARRHDLANGGEGVLDAIGYCVGGTFLATHLSLHPEHAARTAFVCTPIDFHSSGRLVAWANPEHFPLDTLISNVGNYPADLMRTSFSWLKPQGQTAKWVGLWERIEDADFRTLWAALEQWNGDNVDFPGEAYREYVRRCYFENALLNGGWTLGSKTVDLRNAKHEALVIAAATDHIAPQAACYGLAKTWGGPVVLETIKGGHVGVSVGSRLPARLIAWLTQRDEN
ncbi:MAG: alpha/beta fold hydrolase [Myxococcales bacterium]|nr:alpha/beta fold hydrolase [Myxococcales bacterium]